MSSTLTPSKPFAEKSVAAAWNTASRVETGDSPWCPPLGGLTDLRGDMLTNWLVNSNPGLVSMPEPPELLESGGDHRNRGRQRFFGPKTRPTHDQGRSSGPHPHSEAVAGFRPDYLAARRYGGRAGCPSERRRCRRQPCWREPRGRALVAGTERVAAQ